jgi:flagellar hook assembly protein FlgD
MFIESEVNTHRVFININTDLLSAINENKSIREIGNHPNPFNNSTTLKFTLHKTSHVSIEILNSNGQKIKTLTNNTLPEGNHQIDWRGTNDHGETVKAGIYFYRISTKEDIVVRKMLLIR